jgi:hypothetical protein
MKALKMSKQPLMVSLSDSEEFLLGFQKIKRGDPSDLRPQDYKKGKLTKIFAALSPEVLIIHQIFTS